MADFTNTDYVRGILEPLGKSKISELTCNKTTPEDMYVLAKVCVYAKNIDETECFPPNFNNPDSQDYQVRLGISIWILIVMIMAFLGNTLTLIAVPFAYFRKRYSISYIPD